ncbi:type I-B CRISPR-associated endonuclease Cas1b [Clostridium tetani]|uniref:CRISPR-associated endonuclease Cas1 n=1 Tax=Clostridium tetani TaxID=1513 RepID=A0A4Q0VC67_CLOTA|nr:type I-B CRISPR-associated endonuclease Cas1b [Clostridium tetani]RXI49228.1 type I-B CRISPR-associated endonuclease Cas1 [Clostridium tetani]CDI49493.1 maturase-related protein [Clostridium tetani 12124569]
MKRSYYIYNNGALKRKDNSIAFIDELGERRYIPIETVNEIYVMSEMDFNTSLINYLSQYDVIIHFFNYYSFYTGSFQPRKKLVSGNLLVNQVNHYSDNNKRLEIAKKFVDGASYNIYRNLRYYNGRGKDVQTYMDKIEALRKQIYVSANINELMGYEGNIRKIYYEAWNIIIDQKIDFTKRVKNPPDNMINTLISFINTLVYTKILGAIYHTQLNPTVSYLHEPGIRRFSLSLDIAEIFKPILADRLIFSLLNKKQITKKSFTKELNYLHLTKDASKIIVGELDQKLQTTIKHKDLNKNVSYEYLMRLECYKLIKHLLGEKEYEPFKIWW